MKPAIYAVFLCIFCLCARPAAAAESGTVNADHLSLRLIAGTSAGPQIGGAIEISLAEGWHAYWRMPGEGGLPPRFDWAASENADGIEVRWPLPLRFETAGIYSFGYKERVVLPFTFDRPDPVAPVTIALKADIMVCRDICVPQSVSVELAVPAGFAGDAGHEKIISAAMANVPSATDLPGLKIESAVIGPAAAVINAYSRRGFATADVMLEAGDELYMAALPAIVVDDKDPARAMITVAAPAGVDNLAAAVMGEKVTITLTDGTDSVEKSIDF